MNLTFTSEPPANLIRFDNLIKISDLSLFWYLVIFQSKFLRGIFFQWILRKISCKRLIPLNYSSFQGNSTTTDDERFNSIILQSLWILDMVLNLCFMPPWTESWWVLRLPLLIGLVITFITCVLYVSMDSVLMGPEITFMSGLVIGFIALELMILWSMDQVLMTFETTCFICFVIIFLAGW